MNSVVMLRGLLRERGHWGDFPKRVEERLSVKVHCIDLPGIGENSKKTPPFHLFGMAEFVHQRVQELSLQRPVGVIGVSLGGMVALEMMGQFPDSYDKAVVINTSSRLSPSSKRLRRQIWPSFVKVVSEWNKVKREELLVPRVINSPEGREAALNAWTRIAKEQKIHPLTPLAQLKAASGFLPAESLQNSDHILLLSSLGDLFVDPSCSELLHKKYGWRHHAHPWGGHDLVWDDPEWLLKEVHAFFT